MDQSILVNILFDDPKSTKNQRERYNVSEVELYDQLKKSNNDITLLLVRVVKNYQLDKNKSF